MAFELVFGKKSEAGNLPLFQIGGQSFVHYRCAILQRLNPVLVGRSLMLITGSTGSTRREEMVTGWPGSCGGSFWVGAQEMTANRRQKRAIAVDSEKISHEYCP